MSFRRSLVALFGRVTLASAAGCGLNAGGTKASRPPQVTAAHFAALSSYRASLGTPLLGTGTGFPTNGGNRLQLLFKGEFRRDDGRATPVDTAVDVEVRSGQEFLWTTFGPYAHPFSVRGDEPGRFRGTLGVRLVTPDNQNVDDPAPTAITFVVQPSLVVRKFSPVTAQCERPVKRAFSRLPYALVVDAVGFAPRSIRYVVSAPEAGYGETVMAHEVNGNTSDGVLLTAPDIPDGMPPFALVIVIRAEDTSGQAYQTSFSIGVHSPVEVASAETVRTAEIYAPEVVSGCLAGGPLGSFVTYTESMSRTLSQSATYSWDRNWVASHSVSLGTSRSTTEGFSFTTDKSVTNAHSTSDTNGRSTSNGFSIDMKNGRSGSWTIDQTLASTLQREDSRSTTDSSSQTLSISSSQGDLALLGLLGGKGNRLDNASRYTTLPAYIPLGPIVLGSNFSYDHSKKNYTTLEQENSFGSTGSDKESINQGATQSVERGRTANQEINGSETTTDTNSTTQSAGQTMSQSVTETLADGTVVTSLVNQGMSMSNSEGVSSSVEETKDYRGQILAGQFGAFYRQVIRVATHSPIVAYDQCGNGEIVGAITGSAYRFAPDLGQGVGCIPLPPSNLPAARCIISPCTGAPPYDSR